jgi:hypothetical protein
MTRKINISQVRKEELKNSDLSKKQINQLSNEEKRYYQLIENGRKSAKSNVRFEGKYLAGKIVEISQKVADRKNLSLDEYFRQNREAVNELIEKGFTHTSKNIDNAIDQISAMKRKTIEVDTGDGIVRMDKKKAIEQLSLLENHLKSQANVAYLATIVKVFKNGKIRVTIPEDFEDYFGDDLFDYLDTFDEIDYATS